MEKDKFDVNIGKKISTLRKKRGMSQADLAKALDYKSATAISLMENGERSIKTKDVMKITKILDTDLHYLFDDEIKRITEEKLKEVDFKKLVKQKIKELELLVDNKEK